MKMQQTIPDNTEAELSDALASLNEALEKIKALSKSPNISESEREEAIKFLNQLKYL